MTLRHTKPKKFERATQSESLASWTNWKWSKVVFIIEPHTQSMSLCVLRAEWESEKHKSRSASQLENDEMKLFVCIWFFLSSMCQSNKSLLLNTSNSCYYCELRVRWTRSMIQRLLLLVRSLSYGFFTSFLHTFSRNDYEVRNFWMICLFWVFLRWEESFMRQFLVFVWGFFNEEFLLSILRDLWGIFYDF